MRPKRFRFTFDSVLGTFTFYQVIVILLIGLAAVLLGYAVTYRNSVNQLRSAGQVGVDTAANILSKPLWNYDTETLDQYCKVFLESNTICRIVIHGEDGRVVLDVSNHLEAEGPDAEHFSLSRPIYYQNMRIGTVDLTIPLFFAESRARHTVTTMGVMAALLTLVIILTSFVQVRRFILSPLSQLVHRIREIAAGEYTEKISLMQKREYQSIAGEFNAMMDRIRNREQEIQAVSHRLQNLMDTIPDAFILHDRQGRILQVNRTFTDMFGFSEEEALGLTLSQDLNGKGYTEAMAREKLFAGWREGELSFRWVAKRKDDSELPVEIRLKRIQLEEDQYLMAVIRDISRRVRAEQALMESEERFRAMADNTTSAIFIYDEKFLFANPATEQITGFGLDEIKGRPFWELVHPDHREMVKQRGLARLKGENVPSSYQFQILTKSGESRWIEFAAQKIEYEERTCSLGTAVDITDRVMAQQALREEKERLRVTLQSIGDAVIATDRDGKVILLNRVASRLCGWKEEEAQGKSLPEVFHIIHEQTQEPISNPVETVLKTGKVVNISNHTLLVSRDGSEHVIEDSGAPIRNREGQIIGVVLVFRDETDKKRVEEELFRSRKLESIGLLAGGIAHDFNNLLTAIIGNLEMARLKCASSGQASNLTEAENAALRAKDLAGQLLTFSRGGAPIKKKTDIAGLLRDTTNFVLAGSNVSARFFIPSDLPQLQADEGQISQVIQNIVLNADQAMPEGGLIDIATELALIKEHPTIPEGEYVRIFFRDYGIGISRKFLSKVFDPYFTTKQKGNGLGLSTTYSIIKRHEGHIEVSSEPGMGTTFTVLLPVGTESDDLYVPEEETEPLVHGPVSGPLSVLIMDDEDSILEILGEMLSFLGHRVTEALDGEEAIQLVKKREADGNPFDLVILDLTVPGGLGGKEAAAEIKKINPAIRAIVSSGYANDPIMANYKAHGFDHYVAKPFKMNQLAVALRAVMEQKVE